MNPVPFILLAISLPLLLGGCGEKGVNWDELDFREGIWYLKDSDAPYTGKSFTLWENGQKKGKLNFKDGKLDGRQVSWHENGQKKYEGNYKDGKKDGPATAWYSSGEKQEEGNYKDGEMEGLHVRWHKNGQKAREANYKDGKIISAKEWNDKGEPLDLLEEALKESLKE